VSHPSCAIVLRHVFAESGVKHLTEKHFSYGVCSPEARGWSPFSCRIAFFGSSRECIKV